MRAANVYPFGSMTLKGIWYFWGHLRNSSLSLGLGCCWHAHVNQMQGAVSTPIHFPKAERNVQPYQSFYPKPVPGIQSAQIRWISLKTSEGHQDRNNTFVTIELWEKLIYFRIQNLFSSQYRNIICLISVLNPKCNTGFQAWYEMMPGNSKGIFCMNIC